MGRHKKVIILLGRSPLANSINNPLDFESRKQMLMDAYPDLVVLYVKDVNDDAIWSKLVDSIIADVVSPTQSVLLYGSRDSFIKSYVGRFDTVELPAHHAKSGTSIREELGQQAKNSPEWRAGVIWASRNRYPVSYTAVDIAIFSQDYSRLILGRKAHESAWRLPGGFTDPSTASLEEDALREAEEETSVRVKDLRYVRSFLVDDWRYRNEPDSIKTALFVGCTAEEPVAGDDLAEVKWVDVAELDPATYYPVVRHHRELISRALVFTHRERPAPQ